MQGSKHALHKRLRRNRIRHVAGYAIIAALLATWWLTLAPSQIGGPLTFAVVQGTSMEPALKSGDLVAAKAQASYQVGDVIFYKKYGGAVIHRIISREASGQFVTKGLNNRFPDSWLVNEADILGKLVFTAPKAGEPFLFAAQNPALLGLLVAAVLSISFVRIRKPNKTEQLQTLLAHAQAEHPKKGLKPELLLDAVVLIMLLSVTATVVLALKSTPFFPRLALAMLGVVVATILVFIYGNYVLNGSDLAEPMRSLFVLKNRLVKLPGNTTIDGISIDVASSAELRDLAETANLPIIHQVKTPGLTHVFTLVTDKGNYVWRWHPDA